MRMDKLLQTNTPSTSPLPHSNVKTIFNPGFIIVTKYYVQGFLVTQKLSVLYMYINHSAVIGTFLNLSGHQVALHTVTVIDQY